MGLEIAQEFWPITPVRTNPDTRPYNSSGSPTTVKYGFAADQERMRAVVQGYTCKGDDNGVLKVSDLGEDQEECRTPRSEDQLLKTPVLCPPAPRKPRPVKCKSSTSLMTSHHQQLYFNVPSDLSSVFLPLIRSTSTGSSKKIKAG